MAATYPMHSGAYYIRCHIWPNINYGQASMMTKYSTLHVILSSKSLIYIYILRIIKVLILILVVPHSKLISSLKPPHHSFNHLFVPERFCSLYFGADSDSNH